MNVATLIDENGQFRYKTRVGMPSHERKLHRKKESFASGATLTLTLQNWRAKQAPKQLPWTKAIPSRGDHTPRAADQSGIA